jgi:glyoxylate utilization-related uncharacterized protein
MTESIDPGLNVQVAYVANLWCKQMHFSRAGTVKAGHQHLYDHLTLLARGSVAVEVQGQITEFRAPSMIYIQAGQEHKLTALEANTVAYCIHALRDVDGTGDILDPSMIPAGVKYPIAEGLAQPLAMPNPEQP